MDRAQIRDLNRLRVERIRSGAPAPLVEGVNALRVVRTTGRASGAARPAPPAVLLRDGRRYLVAPRAARDWVADPAAHPDCAIEGEDGPFTAVRRVGRDAALVAQQCARTASGPARTAFPFPPDAELAEVVAAMPAVAVFEPVPGS
jgi:hypothetical protein